MAGQTNDEIAKQVQLAFAKCMFEMRVDTLVGASLVSVMNEALKNELARLRGARILSADGTSIQDTEPKAN